MNPRGDLRRWWRWLRATSDCGGTAPARYRDASWNDEVTPDQLQIEDAIAPHLRHDDVVLHVGIGSSRIARRFGSTVAQIDGITVVERELLAAPEMANYRPMLVDKYRALPAGPYTWILDNNPSSFACCRRHFGELLDAYAARLAPGGRLVTELRGLAYAEPYAFGLSPARFQRMGRVRGLRVEWLADPVLAWRRPRGADRDSPPNGTRSGSRHTTTKT